MRVRIGALALAAALLGVSTGCASIHPLNPKHRGFFDRSSSSSDGSSESVDRGSFRPGDLGSADRGGGKAVEVSPVELRWPLEHVSLTSRYGGRGRDFHEGVDLRAHTGTPVYAAQSGTVVYSGSRLRGYGNLVVIRHALGVSTIYAHNSKLLVRSGQVVRQGQKISLSGNTGHSSGPHLHFEVRSGSVAVDPVEALPRFSDTALAHAGDADRVITRRPAALDRKLKTLSKAAPVIRVARPRAHAQLRHARSSRRPVARVSKPKLSSRNRLALQRMRTTDREPN